MSIETSSYKIMKTQPRQHISNKYNTCTVVTIPVYIGSKSEMGPQVDFWDWSDGHGFNSYAQQHLFVEIGHEILSLPTANLFK